MKKLTFLLLINILINFCCISKIPVKNEPIKIYEMTEVEVWYTEFYCYNEQALEPIYDRQEIIDFELKSKKGITSGNIQVFENFTGFGGFYSYQEDYPLNADSKVISGIDSSKGNTKIFNNKVRLKIYDNHQDWFEFIKENSKGKDYFRIAYIEEIYIYGILIN